ncbi:MAG TPA: TlpA disulfide reductase family protein [Thermoanaerobaculia bacterium]|nr:TlpA disulfide reductase family protein [Thermoanaerobaculia bacterium]
MTTMTNLFRSLRSRRSSLVMAVFVSLLIFGCRDAMTAGKAAADKPVDFRLKTVDGRTLGPKDFRGQVVVVDFWATWCGPCHIQARILEPIHRDFHGKGVQFLAANVGEDEATVRGFVKDKPFPYPVLLDEESKVSGNLGVVALPTLMVIDKKGKVSYLESGLADGDTLRAVIKKAGA